MARRIRWIQLGDAALPPRTDRRRLGTPIVFTRADDDVDRDDDRDWRDDLDSAERHLHRAARRTARAANRGLRRYDEARAESAAGDEDGTIVELVPNVARGMAVTGRDLALVPLDLMRAAYDAGGRRLVRRSLRTGRRSDADRTVRRTSRRAEPRTVQRASRGTEQRTDQRTSRARRDR